MTRLPFARHPLLRALALLVPGLAASAGISAAGDLRYTVAVDAALSRLRISTCVAPPGLVLRARNRGAAALLQYARDANGRELPRRRGGIRPPGGCLEYGVDLREAHSTNRRYDALGSDNVALSPANWLWLPPAGAAGVEVSFALPPGVQVSVPWQALGPDADGHPRYRVPASPESDDAVAVFGRFSACTIALDNGALRLALLHGRIGGNTDDLLAWLRSAVYNTTLAYGRFPNPTAQIVVIPRARRRGDDNEPVPFGHVIRDGGEAVQFYANQQQSRAAFVADWTATHEFSHFMLPYINNDENWISEGLASYYQNVLMARGGHYSAAKAWRKIVEGFGRGERAVPHLTLEQAMPQGSWDGIMKTYWGGAALFLMADVELRERTANQQSLDTVLGALAACCLPSTEAWDGKRFVKQLDALAPFPLFEALYEKYRGQTRFPATAQLLRRLGVHVSDGRAQLKTEAPLAALRDAIMATPPMSPTVTASCPAPAPG